VFQLAAQLDADVAKILCGVGLDVKHEGHAVLVQTKQACTPYAMQSSLKRGEK
jgi:hypothetical protein